MDIIYPMFALVVLTFIVGFSTGISRLVSAKKGLVDPKYFRLFAGHTPPDSMLKLGRNFSNLFEVPVLFYAVGIINLTLGFNDKLMIGFAWAFVILRIIHSIIHVTYNNPMHRFLVFLLSSSIVLIMWIQLVTTII
ncbi:MAPEG family protein [Denitrificimonas caeni]|uniref:MAPEG family protein n=1 Tax=Denitrificimonas caeni TaxID=521720 RepID=UPI0019639C65|nr:MAPEG family protein [Denitrificimonas caeni]